jgi:hypothetical protein
LPPHPSLECFHGFQPHATDSASQSHEERPGGDPAASKDEPLKQPEHHHNAAEEGETANIKQNSTNKGFFRGRRQD